MAKASPSFTNDLEYAVDYFRPVLQRLSIRQGTVGSPVFLSSFPNFWNLNNIDKWVVTTLKANLIDSRAKFISQYHYMLPVQVHLKKGSIKDYKSVFQKS